MENKVENLDIDLDIQCVPKHVAIIMDGNGRWAKKQGYPRMAGHKVGMESLKRVVRYASDIRVEHLTVYAFSTENWKRPEEEVNGIFNILVIYLEKEIRELHKNGVKLNILGDVSKLPPKALDKLKDAVELTKNNTGIQFHIALNYGGRDEIVRAVKKIATAVKSGILVESDINEELIDSYLYTTGIPDPELIIRTSGELRLSNFLPWQAAYSEFWFTDTLWPEFTEKDFGKAIYDFQNRKRRFGGV